MDASARHWARLPEIYGLAASGDGEWAFWTGKGDHGADVFCAPVAGGVPAQLTFGTDGHDIRAVSWDGMRLILGQSRHGSGHDHLLLLDREVGNRLHLLTPKQDDHHLGAAAFWGEGVLYLSDQGGPGLWWQDFKGMRERLADLPGLGGISVSASGRALVAAGGEVFLWEAGLWEGGLRRVCAGTHAGWIDEGRFAVRDAGGRVGVFGAGTEWFELGAEAILAGQGQLLAMVQGKALDWRGWREVPNPSARRGFRPGAALPGGWLGLAFDQEGPSEVWAGQRLDRGKGRGHVAPKRAGRGMLYLPEAARGVILWEGAASDRVDPVVGFFTDLGWAVLSPGDAPERAIEATLARSVAPRFAVLELSNGSARCGLWPKEGPGLRVMGRGVEGPPAPGDEVLRFDDEVLGIARPANLELFLGRAALLLQRAFPG